MISLDAATATAALRGVRPAEALSAENAYARAVWSVLVEPGDGTAGAFVAELGAVEALRRIADSTDPGVRQARARWMPRLQPGAVEAALDAARRCGAALVVPGDAAWPTRLDDLGVHAPIALWRRGAVTDAERPAVALVGARASTAYGEGVAADLAADLAGAGVTVVSGAAYGIDGACHRAALSTGGTTVAFLAGGVDRPYPRGHESLLAQIAATGAVWSETPCGSAPTKWRFLSPKRSGDRRAGVR